jgi:hypothetical protein
MHRPAAQEGLPAPQDQQRQDQDRSGPPLLHDEQVDQCEQHDRCTQHARAGGQPHGTDQCRIPRQRRQCQCEVDQQRGEDPLRDVMLEYPARLNWGWRI